MVRELEYLSEFILAKRNGYDVVIPISVLYPMHLHLKVPDTAKFCKNEVSSSTFVSGKCFRAKIDFRFSLDV